MLCKRISLWLKLRRLCRKKGFLLVGTRPLWLFGGKRGKTCDFYVETPTSVYAVKLFGIKKRMNTLAFTEGGHYIIRKHLAFMGNMGQGVMFPIDSVPKKLHTYDFRAHYRDAWYTKGIENILLVHPICREISRSVPGKSDIVLGSGEILAGMRLFSLSHLLGELELI